MFLIPLKSKEKDIKSPTVSLEAKLLRDPESRPRGPMNGLATRLDIFLKNYPNNGAAKTHRNSGMRC